MSKELAKTYDPKGIEERLYTKWMDNGYFHAKVNPDKKPFTIEGFPCPPFHYRKTHPSPCPFQNERHRVCQETL